MNEVLEYFQSLDGIDYLKRKIKLVPSKTEIKVFGSITPYLFEDINVELMSGDYIILSETISDEDADYVIDGNIITKVNNHSYEPSDIFVYTGLKASDISDGLISITEDGFYSIDGKKTSVLAPTKKDGTLLNDSFINSCGIGLTLFDDDLFMSKTSFDNKSKKIVCDGYESSIKIKINFKDDCNFYYTMQLAAKLSSMLADHSGLSISDVKSLEFFKGNLDPINIYKNDLWDYFKALVQVENDVSYYKSIGYEVSFSSRNKYINPNGTIDKLPSIKGIDYTIKTKYNGEENSLSFMKLL